MKIKQLFILMLFTSFFIGCSQLRPVIIDKTGINPPLNIKLKKNVGDIIFEQFNYNLTKSAYLKNDYYDTFGLGKIYISQKDILIYYSDGKNNKYCTLKKTYIDPIVGPYCIVCFSGID
jgi:hypothetical protein